MARHGQVCVVGAGPAGAAAVLSLHRHAPALEVTWVVSPGPRPSLGETLSPAALPLLQALGLDIERCGVGQLRSHGTLACWEGASVQEVPYLLRGAHLSWHLDRRRFEEVLRGEVVATGVQTKQARVETVRHCADGVSLGLDDGECLVVAQVIDATGRAARVATALGAERVWLDRQVAWVQAWADTGLTDTRTLVEAGQSGWSYSALCPDGSVVVAGFGLLGDAPVELGERTRARLGVGHALGPPHRVAAFGQTLDRCFGDGWMAIGDAALAPDPLSSSGIARALAAGLAAGQAVASGSPGVDRDLPGYLAQRRAVYARQQRFVAHPYWQMRHERITLDPEQPVQAAARPSRTALWLSRSEQARLLELCTQPTPAHALLAQVREDIARPVEDVGLVLALQDLIDQHAVSLRAHPREL